jgi:hypothetical protein
MSENVHTILSNRGIKIPLNELKVAYASGVRIEKTRAYMKQWWRDITGTVASATNIATNVLTAVHTVKQMNDKGYFEPVLNCRHHLPPG